MFSPLRQVGARSNRGEARDLGRSGVCVCMRAHMHAPQRATWSSWLEGTVSDSILLSVVLAHRCSLRASYNHGFAATWGSAPLLEVDRAKGKQKKVPEETNQGGKQKEPPITGVSSQEQGFHSRFPPCSRSWSGPADVSGRTPAQGSGGK